MLLLALPAILVTIYVWLAMQVYVSRWSADPFPLALIAIFITVAVYFVIDRRWATGNVGGAIGRSIIIFLLAAIGLAIEIPSGVTIGQRMRQKETLKRMRAIAAALDDQRTRLGHYPKIDRVNDLGANLPSEDAWSHAFALHSEPATYVLISYGLGGTADVRSPAEYQAGPTTRFEDDIVLRDNQFVRFPEGTQP